jgi:hypothetical protein
VLYRAFTLFIIFEFFVVMVVAVYLYGYMGISRRTVGLHIQHADLEMVSATVLTPVTPPVQQPVATPAPVATSAPTQAPPATPVPTQSSSPPTVAPTQTPAPIPTATPVPVGGSLTNNKGQEWIPIGNGRYRVKGPAGEGEWDETTQSWVGPGRPGQVAPTPKKSSSGGSGQVATPTPTPIKLSSLLSTTPIDAKACKNVNTCTPVKISYSTTEGLVVKKGDNVTADLSGVTYIEFIVGARTYRISVNAMGTPETVAK